MEKKELSIRDVVTLIYGSEDDKLAHKVLHIFLAQQKKIWEDNNLDTLASNYSVSQRDAEECSK